jgi:hypothetical protein
MQWREMKLDGLKAYSTKETTKKIIYREDTNKLLRNCCPHPGACYNSFAVSYIKRLV